MTKWNRILTMAVFGLLLTGAAAADTLELKDGRILQGRYMGGTRAVLRFEVDGSVQTFSTNDVVALTFTNDGRDQAPAPAAAPIAAGPQTDAASSGNVTLPAGQSLLVRMIDGVDSSKNH